MNLSCSVPANTQKARTTEISAFERILKEENVSMNVIQACILPDKTYKTLAALVDRFDYHLATYEGKKGKLASNAAISYYRNVKLWFFDTFRQLRVPTELVLLKQGKALEKHCLKHENGGTAAVLSDYEDAALACLMWYCFGRSSDLGYVSKQHITMSADKVFFVRMLRVKTAEEQGLTLVHDRDDFLTARFTRLQSPL
ncbi:Hypothetical protein PHPALM_8502 [Phytophthora palmivora]|uniref:Uncharacterized protein n=1 Tax=Phytophthora palmivora TaxID=4796 RepID=A0A2P4Y9P6_9STRA|nr:Hypothetical protein PHPALM_8502 [Phytophthora palmivora]